MSQIFRFSTVWEGGGRMVWKKDEHAYTWNDLDGHVAPEILCAPRTGSDPTGTWPKVHARARICDAQCERQTLDRSPRAHCRSDDGAASRCRDSGGDDQNAASTFLVSVPSF